MAKSSLSQSHVWHVKCGRIILFVGQSKDCELHGLLLGRKILGTTSLFLHPAESGVCLLLSGVSGSVSCVALLVVCWMVLGAHLLYLRT